MWIPETKKGRITESLEKDYTRNEFIYVKEKYYSMHNTFPVI